MLVSHAWSPLVTVDVCSTRAALRMHLEHGDVELLQDADDLRMPALEDGVEGGPELLVAVPYAHGHAPRERHARHGIRVRERHHGERHRRPLHPVPDLRPPRDGDVDRVLHDRVDDVLRVVRLGIWVIDVAALYQPNVTPGGW